MQINQQEQKWLVLLFSLIELDGGSQRKNVLQHIQANGYWYKNDQNDVSRTTRNEKAWRNDFSYERQHLVEHGYMKHGKHGIWEITENGRQYVETMADRIKDMPIEKYTCFTAVFYQKFFCEQIHPELTADQNLFIQLAQSTNNQDEPSAVLINEPKPKGPVANQSANKSTYLRNPAVARRALARANHQCEVDSTHTSFLRRNSPYMYMEPHHLVPMSMTDQFKVSLDREQNIFSLCSNCHNQIHYGTKKDVRQLITRLFLSRQQEICAILNKNITLEEIYQIYNV